MWKAFLLTAALLSASCASSGASDQDGAEQADAIAVSVAYPLDTCLVSGEPLPEEGYETRTVEGQELRFCCGSCARVADNDPAAALAEFDIAVQRATYPLETCAVAGSPLGSMGAPIEVMAGDTLVLLCCGGCKSAISADPVKFETMIAEARAAAE